jgi:multiple sugar transport system permease protein
MKSRYFIPAFFIAASFTAMAPVFGQTQKREVVFWGMQLGPDDKGPDAAIREFERLNPDIHVKMLSMGAGQMDPQKLTTSIIGNVAPDVIKQDRFTIADWASRNAFLPLTPLMERDKGQPDCPSPDQYYTAPWNEATYQRNTYAIPMGADNRILYWNRKVFLDAATEIRKAGLDPERAPRTWSEALAYSKAITKFDKNGKLLRAGFMPNFGNSWLYMFAFQNNASFMSEDGRTCTMDTPEAREALQFIVDGYKLVGGYENAKAFESGFRGGENDAFILGQVGMKIDGDWIINGLARYAPLLDFGVAPPPVPDDRYYKRGRFVNEQETFISWVGGFSLAIPRGARNVEDGWKLIKFLSSEEGLLVDAKAQANWERLKGRVYIPRQIAQRKTNELFTEMFKPATPNYAAAVKMHTDIAAHTKIRPATFVGQLLWSEHVRAMESACYGKLTPTAALRAAQQKVQDELDRFYSKEKYPVINMAWISALVALVLLSIFAYFVVIIRRAKLDKMGRYETLWGYLMASPWIIGFMVLILGPMVASFFWSFTRWDILNEARFVGTSNYQLVFGSDWDRFAKGLSNAAYLAFVGVPLGIVTGLSIAILLNAATRGIRFYRTAFYLPAIVPVIASAVLWLLVLTPDPMKGLLNSFWVHTITPWLGIKEPGWLNSADYAKPALVVMGLWGAGGGMLFWLAGLKGIPKTLYEAAALDGASPLKQFFSVTLPHLTPMIFFNVVMGLIGAFQEFDRAYAMRTSKDGPIGPDDSLLTPVYNLFIKGFGQANMGDASTHAWLIFVIVMTITLVQWKLKDRWVFSEMDNG